MNGVNKQLGLVSRRVHRRRALSLVEAVGSVMIVGIMMVAALETVSSAKISRRSAADHGIAMHLAQDMMSEILLQGYADADSGVDSFGLGGDEVGDGSRALWEDVDDYDGWGASPPQARDGTEMTDYEGWGRMVTVEWVDPDDLQSVYHSNTGAKLITVEVTHRNLPVFTLTAVRGQGSSAATSDMLIEAMAKARVATKTAEDIKVKAAALKGNLGK